MTCRCLVPALDRCGRSSIVPAGDLTARGSTWSRNSSRLAHARGGGQWYLGLYLAGLVRTCMASSISTPWPPSSSTTRRPGRHGTSMLGFTAQAVLAEARGDLHKAAGAV